MGAEGSLLPPAVPPPPPQARRAVPTPTLFPPKISPPIPALFLDQVFEQSSGCFAPECIPSLHYAQLLSSSGGFFSVVLADACPFFLRMDFSFFSDLILEEGSTMFPHVNPSESVAIPLVGLNLNLFFLLPLFVFSRRVHFFLKVHSDFSSFSSIHFGPSPDPPRFTPFPASPQTLKSVHSPLK